jgi:hypothetical protein
MKAHPSSPSHGAAQLGEGEPLPLPPPPPPYATFEDDHYFDDDDEPSWWSTIRPITAVHPATPRRARTSDDEISAATHVLRVRARLAPDEQLAFDELMSGPAATDIITMLVNRSEDDAVDRLRRRLDDEPTAAEAARRALSRRIAALAALLSAGEQARAHAGLAFLWPEELAALQARLAGLSPPEAAALIRTYLASRR